MYIPVGQCDTCLKDELTFDEADDYLSIQGSDW
jgi:hypothetical protein